MIFDIVAQHTQHGKNGWLKFFLCRKLFSISHRLLACLDVFAPTIGKPLAVVNTMLSSKAILRKLQILRRDDEDVIHTGLDMLNAKVVNQAAILKYFYK